MLSRLAVASSVIALALAGNVRDRSYYEEKFFGWMETHGVKPTNGLHFVQMLQNFANNDDLIESHNAKNLSYKLGHNKFSHMNVEEWRDYVKLGLGKPTNEPAPQIHRAPADKSTIAASIDWVAAGAVTPVKDQGQCGSCWSFSATGALEGAYKVAGYDLESFSEQNLVDCDNFRHGGTDLGCNGGLMDSAFKWVTKNGGLCTEADYPYVSGTTKKNGDCTQDKKTKNTNVTPSTYTDVETNSVDALKSALNIGPVSVAIQADQAAFQLYKSGVFTADCGTNLDHGVLATGYGSLDGQEYWSIKNSWGTSWGQDGYILFAIDVAQKEGQCGVLSGPPSFPTVPKKTA